MGLLAPTLLAGLALIALPSFLWSVRMTASGDPAAFFVTTTRLWELAIGAAVALGASLWPRVPVRAAQVLGWVGILAVAYAGLGFGATTPWPGSAALVPTLGTAAVIVAGYHPGGVGPLLSVKPMVWIGGLSYSLYLWHWPVLIFGAAILGELGQKTGLLVTAAAFVPAWLCHKLLENPLRFHPALVRSNALSLTTGLNFTLLGALVGLLVIGAAAPAATGSSAVGAPGVAVVDDTQLEPEVADRFWQTKTSPRIVPDPRLATEDVPVSYDEGCQASGAHKELVPCEYGASDGDIHLLIVGDSKVL